MATIAEPERTAPQQPTYHEITRDVVATGTGLRFTPLP